MKKSIFLVLLAGIAGALAGILMAPDKGSETRKKISKRSEKKGDFPEKTYYSHRHEELEISMLSEGSCKMECNKKIYRLYKNKILIINIQGDLQ